MVYKFLVVGVIVVVTVGGVGDGIESKFSVKPIPNLNHNYP